MSKLEGLGDRGVVEIKIEMIENTEVGKMSENLETKVTVDCSCPLTSSKVDELSSVNGSPDEKQKKIKESVKASKKRSAGEDLLDEIEEMSQKELEEVVPVTQVDETDDTFEVDKSDAMNLNLVESDLLQEDFFAWQNFVKQIKVEVGAKKRKYQKLVEKKTELVSAKEKVKGVKQARELKICCAAEEMRVKRELLNTLGRRYEEIKKEITKEIKEMDALSDCVCEETKKVDDNSRTIQKIETVLKQVEDDLKSTCQMNEVEANDKLKTANEKNAYLKQFLTDCIADKEKQLQCQNCEEMASPPIYKCSTEAEHLICSSCCIQLKNKCPACKIRMAKTGFVRFKYAEAVWEEWKKLISKFVDPEV